MTINDITTLSINATILFLALIIYSFIKTNYVDKFNPTYQYTASYQLINGFVLGLIAVMIMVLPSILTKTHGFTFDARFILLGSVAFLFHIRTTLVCILMISLCRIFLLDGNFNVVLAIFIASCSIAIVAYYWQPRYKTTTRVYFHNLLFYSVTIQVVHLTITFYFVSFDLFQHIFLTFLLIYPPLTASIIYYLNKQGERPARLLENLENSYLFNVQYHSQSVGFSIISPSKALLKANAAFCKLLGYSEKELKKLKWTDYTHPDDQEISLTLFNDLLSGKIDQYSLTKRLIRKDGEAINVQLNIYGVRNESNAVEFFVTTYMGPDHKANRVTDALQYVEEG